MLGACVLMRPIHLRLRRTGSKKMAHRSESRSFDLEHEDPMAERVLNCNPCMFEDSLVRYAREVERLRAIRHQWSGVDRSCRQLVFMFPAG